jgi:hypothetical protein
MSIEKAEIVSFGSADQGWSGKEFSELALGDARVERRLRKVAEDLSNQPEYPINQASEDAAATKAAYRLFDNERVSANKIFAAHESCTLKRMNNEPVILAIQDTSFLNFSGHKKTKGLGPIGDSIRKAQGLILHSTLAVTPAGLPMGVLTYRCWAREGFWGSDDKSRQALPIEEKESYRWIETLREIEKLSRKLPKSKVVTVADRECDIYEFLLEAQALNANYVIRAKHDRHLRADDECAHLQELIKAIPSETQIELNVPSEKRKATLELRFSPVTFRAPDRISRSQKKFLVNCWVVHVKEINALKKVEPLSWTLLTNVPVTSVEQALESLAWYRRRWSIEEFHKILKSGCTVEDCRLQTSEKLKRYLALFSVIAWRIFWMVHIKRANPKAPAEIVLTRSEIGTLQTLERFKELIQPEKKFTVKVALTAIACLGGYLNRKNDPHPGATVLWRGWQQLSAMAELYDGFTGCG